LHIQQRTRRARRRLESLMRENTARLWQKAQELDDGSEDWWNLVRRDIEQAITRRKRDNDALLAQIEQVTQEVDAHV
jgi:hypothetical protein